MTAVVFGLLLLLAALSLGLRTTAVFISPFVHPVIRLALSMIVGTVLVLAGLELSDSYRVFELGLGLLMALAPVGLFDLAKWWFRWRR